MACPSNPEEKRPKNFVEAISGDECWNTFGIRIKWTDPVVPGNLKLPISQPVTLKLCVETKKDFKISSDALSAWCWTHIRADDNPCGIWREIRLHYIPKCTIQDEHGHTSHVFQASVTPTADDLYRLTFNVKYERLMIWANYFQVDNVVDVQVNPSVGTQYEKVVGPPAWRAILCRLMPKSFPFYSTYFCNLFTEGEQPSTSQIPRYQFPSGKCGSQVQEKLVSGADVIKGVKNVLHGLYEKGLSTCAWNQTQVACLRCQQNCKAAGHLNPTSEREARPEAKPEARNQGKKKTDHDDVEILIRL